MTTVKRKFSVGLVLTRPDFSENIWVIEQAENEGAALWMINVLVAHLRGFGFKIDLDDPILTPPAETVPVTFEVRSEDWSDEQQAIRHGLHLENGVVMPTCPDCNNDVRDLAR